MTTRQERAQPDGPPDGPIDAITLLKADHDKVKALFSEIEGADSEEAVAVQIFNELEIHALVEEELFYPAVEAELSKADLQQEGEDPASLIATAQTEHQTVKQLVSMLKKLDIESEEYRERFAELKDAVLDHVSEEEEVVFPAAQLKLDVQSLGAKMQERRISLAASMARG